MKGRRAALYIRVSTDRQSEEGYSIEFQEEKLRAYCTATNMVVYDTFIDPGYTGSDINRPALQAMIDRIHEFDAVLVYKLDRLSRSQKDTLYLIEDIFIPNDIAFISLSESFDTSTPLGRAMVGILSAFAQLERENIKERMISGRIQRAKEGLHNGQAFTPIGYRYIDGKLVVDEYEAEQIRYLADLYLMGYGTARMLSEMNKRGYRTSYGQWSRSTINTILFNPVYRGKVTFGGEEYEGQHERIISDETYTKLLEQKILRAKGAAFKRSYLLSGLLWCKHCGTRIAGKNRHGRKYYACYSASKSSRHMVKDPDCKLPAFPKDLIENKISEYIMDIYNDTDYYIEKHKAEHKQPDTSLYDKRLQAIEKQTKRLLDLYQYGEIEATEIRKRIEEMQDEKNAILQAKKQVIRYDYEEFRDIVKSLGDDWNDLNTDEKREYLMSMIEKIELDLNGNIGISIKVNEAK